MIYDYLCLKKGCNHRQEEIHSYQDRPDVSCEVCGGKCIKLISTGTMFCGVNGRGNMYDFVDHNTTGQPVKISSKTQWRNHLKAHGLNDDVKNDPYTKSELESKVRQKQTDKDNNKKKIKSAVIEAYRNRRSSAAKQRVKEVLKKGV